MPTDVYVPSPGNPPTTLPMTATTPVTPNKVITPTYTFHVNSDPAAPVPPYGVPNHVSSGMNEADEIDLYTPARMSGRLDSPFGPSDLEWLYRSQDVDGPSLSSRLAQLAPISFNNPLDGIRRRRLFALDTWELNNFVWANDNPSGAFPANSNFPQLGNPNLVYPLNTSSPYFNGKPSVASWSEPFVVAPHYREMPGLDLLTKPVDFPSAPDVMVTFDCGSLGRLGDLEPAATNARELIVIDHHISNTRYGTINVIDPAAAASGVVVRRLLDSLGLELNRDAAHALYAALVCDTGRFQYDTTTPAVFDLARELVSFDLPISRLSRQLFEEHRFAYLKLLAEGLETAQLDVERRFVWTAVTQDMLERHDVTLDEVEGLIDVLRRTTEAEVTCVLKEEADGTVRVSLRSLGDVDVCKIADEHGGGGHRFAAGFSSPLSIPTLVARISASL